MKAIVYHAPRDFRVESVPDPKLLSSTDAVVRVERTAICGSDLHLWHGAPLPVSFVMGHEFMGVGGYQIFDAHEEDVLKVVLQP